MINLNSVGRDLGVQAWLEATHIYSGFLMATTPWEREPYAAIVAVRGDLAEMLDTSAF